MNATQNETSENYEVMTFQFSESKQPVRNVLIDNKPWFVGKDVCDVLGIQNNRQAIRELDDDEKLMYKIYTSGQNRDTWIISESGLYALIFRSNKPYAKTFRKWITSEVIPALLKKGYYNIRSQKKDDYIDYRSELYQKREFLGKMVRFVVYKNEEWFSVNDLHSCVNSSTGSNKTSKSLNKSKTLALKFWIVGNTQPAWFCNKLGSQLILAGSKKAKESMQLTFKFDA